MTVYKVTYKNNNFTVEQHKQVAEHTQVGEHEQTGGEINDIKETDPIQTLQDVIHNTNNVNDPTKEIEELIVDVETKSKSLKDAIATYQKALELLKETNKEQQNHDEKSWTDRINIAKKLEGGKRKSFRRKNKRNKKNNSKRKHNGTL